MSNESSSISNPPTLFLKLLFTIRETSHALGISPRTVQNLIATKALPVRRIGRRVLVHHKDLERFARADHRHLGEN